MRILILADIHFKDGEHEAPDDHYGRVRDAFLNAMTRVKEVGGAIDLVLVAGDIAFGGKAAEYDIARAFLRDTEAALDQSGLDIIVAPGNHDFDRGYLKIDPLLAYVHETTKPAFRKGDGRALAAFGAWLRSEASRKTLLKPFAAFEEFAASLGETRDDTIGAAKPVLRPIFEGVDLRIFSLSTAIMASSDDDRGSLLVEPSYNAVRRDRSGVINLVLMHHPPMWAANGADVTNALRLLSDIVVLGHEHSSQNYAMGDRLMWIDAGSLQPEKDGREPPHFAILELIAKDEDPDVRIGADLSVYRYRRNEDRFMIDQGDGGATYSHAFAVRAQRSVKVPPNAETMEPEHPTGGAADFARVNVRAEFFRLGASERNVVCDGIGVTSTTGSELAEEAALRQWSEIERRALAPNVRDIILRLRDTKERAQ